MHTSAYVSIREHALTYATQVAARLMPADGKQYVVFHCRRHSSRWDEAVAAITEALWLQVMHE